MTLHESATKKKFIPCAILILFLSALPGAVSDSRAEPEAGFPAPDFTLAGLNGKKHRLSDYKGKVVLLNVWATWCGPCGEEMPALESVYRQLKGEKFILLAVSIDKGKPDLVKKYVEKKGLTFPVLLSPDGMFETLYMVPNIPLTLIIDKSGTIVSRIPGVRQWDSPGALEGLRILMEEEVESELK